MSDDLVGRGRVIAQRLNALAGVPSVKHVVNDDVLTAVPGSRNEETQPGTATVPGSRNRLGTAASESYEGAPVGENLYGSRFPTPLREPGTAREKPLYVDISAMLDGTVRNRRNRSSLGRSDGRELFYAGQVNLLFGDPESGKTWVCLACLRWKHCRPAARL